MPRPPRLRYPGAIYHLVTRGDGRRTLFHDDAHYARFTQGLSDEISRSDWIVLVFCWMPNEIDGLVTCFKDATKRSRLKTRDTIRT